LSDEIDPVRSTHRSFWS